MVFQTLSIIAVVALVVSMNVVAASKGEIGREPSIQQPREGPVKAMEKVIPQNDNNAQMMPVAPNEEENKEPRTSLPTGLKGTGWTAFSAYRSSSFVASPIENSYIVYQFTSTNYGNAFDGIFFTAPVSGVYFFSFTGVGKNMLAHISLDGVTQASIWNGDTRDETQLSTSIIIDVNKDQRVWTVLRQGNTLSDSVAQHSRFTGYLMQEII